MTPEQEVLANQLEAIATVVRSARYTMPRDRAAFSAMTEEQQIPATAMLKQFEQLEGLLSGLFRAVLRTMAVRLKGLYQLDLGNRMAELDIIDDPAGWVAIVKLRNELVHEYPLGASDRYDRFAAAYDAFPFLFNAAERASRVIAARGLLGDRS